jgi:hypothetical protein
MAVLACACGAPASEADRGTAVGNVHARFGGIPSPLFNPESNTAPEAAAAGHGPWYGGLVTLTWTGHLAYSIQAAPVFRYAEPTAHDVNAFALSLGAAPESNGNKQIVRYGTPNFTLKVDGTTPTASDPRPASPPTFFIFPAPTPAPTVPAGISLAGFAAQYLAQLGLTPQWPHTVEVEGSTVLFLRQVAVSGHASPAHVIDSGGRYSGLEVDFTGDKLLRVVGPLPIGLDSTNYAIIPADQAVREAIASSPPPAGEAARPTVQLTSAELVYALAPGGLGGYYEPALLFSGTFKVQGTTFAKLVLVPLVDPSLRSS